jgi:UDPglucose--hexose-1-phosphate uridylyltransferase
MHELRWDPQLREWVIIASHREGRPTDPDRCPFCDMHVPDVIALDNAFPSLLPLPEDVVEGGEEIRKRGRALGKCEVILYSSDHEDQIEKLEPKQIERIVGLWKERYMELSKDFKYVFIFENRGKQIGVTLTHPHGQIYALPFIPPIIQKELDSSEEYFRSSGGCLYCDLVAQELEEKERMINENSSFVQFVPFWAHWPFESLIIPKRHLTSIIDLDHNETRDLALLLKSTFSRYNDLFSDDLSYVMALHQKPSRGYERYHLHIEIYAMNREGKKFKFRGGVETGVGTFINPVAPEDATRKLRG